MLIKSKMQAYQTHTWRQYFWRFSSVTLTVFAYPCPALMHNELDIRIMKSWCIPLVPLDYKATVHDNDIKRFHFLKMSIDCFPVTILLIFALITIFDRPNLANFLTALSNFVLLGLTFLIIQSLKIEYKILFSSSVHRCFPPDFIFFSMRMTTLSALVSVSSSVHPRFFPPDFTFFGRLMTSSSSLVWISSSVRCCFFLVASSFSVPE